MKRILLIALSLVLAVLTAALMPAQVFADSLPDYVSEVKVFYDSYSDAEKQGYTVLKDDDKNVVDLNKGAGGGWGSKGNRAVYLGYKTTTNRKDAITDLALMNMKGGYDVAEYESLMNTQIKSQILPFVDDFLVAIDEYRVNYDPEYHGANKQRADYIHDSLNKLTDDDCDGKGLGDLLLNTTKYEYGQAAYAALSDAEKEKTSVYEMSEKVYKDLSEEEKKNCPDIVTIIAQSNGMSTLLMQDLLTRACDVNEDNWVERFVKTAYDDLIDYTGLAPTDARRELARLYDDDANTVLDMWDTFRNQLLKADETAEILDETDTEKMEENSEVFNNFDLKTATDNDLDALAEASVDVEINTEVLANRVNDVIAKEYLSDIDYGDGTLYDFFTQTREEVEDDITVLYPLVASLSPGQRAGLEFVSLSTLVTIAGTGNNYSDEEIDKLEPVSIYNGVDRAIYEKGGVALTSDTLRKDPSKLAVDDNSGSFPFNWWTILSGGFAIASVTAFFVAFGKSRVLSTQLKAYERLITSQNVPLQDFNTMCRNFSTQGRTLISSGSMKASEYQRILFNLQQQRREFQSAVLEQTRFENAEYARLASRSSMCNKLAIGFGIAMLVISALTVYLTWRDMVAYYKVDFSPIPHYMIDEKDLIGYNKKGEKIILKNQTAYYKAVESNAQKGDFKFDEIGNLADMNGCVGKQWLALYAVKNELMDPISASSLTVVTGKADIPAGYSTGIHMFGSSSAFNLNSSLYDWNSDATSVFVYFKTVIKTENASVAANFSGGTAAIAGGAGLVVGALATAFGMTSAGKKKKAEAKA